MPGASEQSRHTQHPAGLWEKRKPVTTKSVHYSLSKRDKPLKGHHMPITVQSLEDRSLLEDKQMRRGVDPLWSRAKRHPALRNRATWSCWCPPSCGRPCERPPSSRRALSQWGAVDGVLQALPDLVHTCNNLRLLLLTRGGLLDPHVLPARHVVAQIVAEFVQAWPEAQVGRE